MEIRDAAAADVPAIWPFLHEIVAAGDTFCARGERNFMRGLPRPARDTPAARRLAPHQLGFDRHGT
jgi:hypothetical protein